MEGGANATDRESSPEAISSASHLLSGLPTREGWSQPLVLYKNYWLRPHLAENIVRLHTIFKPRHDDIILASNPKCGTTWLKALAFAITNRSRYGDFGNNHPLLSRNPHELVPTIEIPLYGDLASVEALPSPRLLTTHMPPSLFPDPESIASCGCRFVYVCREPKDAFVSRWHFENKMVVREHAIELEPAINMFVEGFSAYGPFWQHCLEYWRASMASPDMVLFIKYEDMISAPVKHVVRLATFLGVPFSAKEVEDGVPEELVRLCSFEKLSGANQTGNMGRRGHIVFDKSVFFRKGIVGDWVNHMSEEMGRKIDCVVKEKFKGSGLVL